jgi:hypothetical protein
MAWSIDARIPLTLLEDGPALAAALAAHGGDAALLLAAPPGALPQAAMAQASFVPGLAHAGACACCAGRGAAAAALDRLFQARARGQCGWFARVLAVAEGAARAEVEAALRDDAVTAARFRLEQYPF